MKDPEQQIPPSMTADLFSSLQDDGVGAQPQDPAVSAPQNSVSAPEDLETPLPSAPITDSLQSSSGSDNTGIPPEDPSDIPLPDYEEEEAPLYYAPGEPLSGKPGEYFRRRQQEALAETSAAQADADQSPLAAEDPATGTAAPAPQSEAPHFDNIKVSGPDADRFLDEISKIPPKSESSQNVGTASSALFKNVVRRSAPAATPLPDEAPAQVTATQGLPPSPDPVGTATDTSRIKEPSAASQSKAHHGHGIHNSFKILLFVRQIVASFFTHTALGVIFPRVAAKLGPCFPSSMPVPYFLTGFVTALPILAIKSVIDVPDVLCCALAALVFIVFNGISGFRGITKLCAVFSSSRSDFALATTVTATYLMVLLALLMSLTYLMEPTLQFALILGATLSLSALAGCSLQFSLEADPVDSYGSMSLKGLLFSLVVVLAAVYAVLPPLVATSMVGMALLCNLLFGLYMNVRGLLISRSAVGAVQLITQLMLMLYLTLASGRMLI